MSYSPAAIAKFTLLYSKNLVPLKVVLPSLTWVLHDYLVTLEDEVTYIWGQKMNIGKAMFLFVRYYTILLLLFDAIQIHTFAIPGVTSDTVCVFMHPTIRLLGAISLWSIEIVMQLRIYALFNLSMKVAIFNGVLFAVSIGAFMWMLVLEATKRHQVIASAIRLPLPGCPVINGGSQWALWMPATGFELILFGFALYKSAETFRLKVQMKSKMMPLTAVLVGDNILYFFGVSALLIFNNLMTVGAAKIPWFSFGPFHAALGIMTTRMLMHLVKAAEEGPNGMPFYISQANVDSLSYPMSVQIFEVHADNRRESSSTITSSLTTPIMFGNASISEELGESASRTVSRDSFNVAENGIASMVRMSPIAERRHPQQSL